MSCTAHGLPGKARAHPAIALEVLLVHPPTQGQGSFAVHRVLRRRSGRTLISSDLASFKAREVFMRGSDGYGSLGE